MLLYLDFSYFFQLWLIGWVPRLGTIGLARGVSPSQYSRVRYASLLRYCTKLCLLGFSAISASFSRNFSGLWAGLGSCFKSFMDYRSTRACLLCYQPMAIVHYAMQIEQLSDIKALVMRLKSDPVTGSKTQSWLRLCRKIKDNSRHILHKIKNNIHRILHKIKNNVLFQQIFPNKKRVASQLLFNSHC